MFLLFAMQRAAAAGFALEELGRLKGNLLALPLSPLGRAYEFSRGGGDSRVGLFVGFAFGVAVCEEVCKAFPSVWFAKRWLITDPAEACSIGFASGVGFGLVEGIWYPTQFYNGHYGVVVGLVGGCVCSIAAEIAYSPLTQLAMKRSQDPAERLTSHPSA